MPRFKTVTVKDHAIFYREAGNSNAPAILLLHGFPTSSFMYRQIQALLSDRFRLIAPDLPGFGFTKSPPRGKFDYTFANLAETIAAFTDAIGLKRFALMVFDYGAAVGFRLALKHPERIT